jgi:hypothetical protein
MFFLLAGVCFGLARKPLTYEACEPIRFTRVDRTRRRGSVRWRATKIVLRNPWARIMLLVVGLEGALFQGIFPFVSADLHLRFGLSFTAIGLIIGVFATGGLIYAATVKPLMRRPRPDRHRHDLAAR